MESKKPVKRVPAHISGRSFSNGIMLRGGRIQALAYRKKNGEVEITAKNVKLQKKSGTLSAFINMLCVAFGGIIESFKLLSVTRSFSLKRLFKYHGAEHKVIHCYEDGLELTVENAKKCSTYHPRCGTSLAANVLILEGILCLLVPAKIRNALCGVVDIILFIAAFFAGFKLTRYAADKNSRFADAVKFPGKLLQKLTALEPTEEMLECGIEAAKKLVQSEYR